MVGMWGQEGQWERPLQSPQCITIGPFTRQDNTSWLASTLWVSFFTQSGPFRQFRLLEVWPGLTFVESSISSYQITCFGKGGWEDASHSEKPNQVWNTWSHPALSSLQNHGTSALKRLMILFWTHDFHSIVSRGWVFVKGAFRADKEGVGVEKDSLFFAHGFFSPLNQGRTKSHWKPWLITKSIISADEKLEAQRG